MKKSSAKTTTGKLHMARRASLKTRTRSKTISSCRAGQAKTGGFCYRELPFVKSLSRKNVVAARVLKHSYKRGVDIAAHSKDSEAA